MRADPPLLDAAGATLGLLQLAQRADGAAARRFVLLDGSREVWPFQLGVLWRGAALDGHSGVADVEPRGPYAQWLARLQPVLQARGPGRLGEAEVGAALADGWHAYWPPYALWLPAGDDGWLLLRELPWTDAEVDALARWWLLWRHEDVQAARAARAREAPSWTARLRGRPRRAAAWGAAALIGALLWPVHLTLRAPGEIVPRQPQVLRAAVDGTVRALKVEPNQPVKAGQVLAEIDDAGWHSRMEVARQALATAEAEWRQVNQQALNDARANAQLAAALGKVEERRADLAYFEQQVQRSTLVAPQDGVVLIQDPGSWAGRTIAAGEAVMKLARPDDQEVEAWLAVGDAVELADGSPMALHLASRPGAPVTARLRSYAFEAEQRPDLGLGYRLRGTLDGAPRERLGARGTVRVDGPRVPLVYWLLRRPLAALREASGW